jgi:hypothetical protein
MLGSRKKHDTLKGGCGRIVWQAILAFEEIGFELGLFFG